MKENHNPTDRRNFIKKTSLPALGSSSLLAFSNFSSTLPSFTQDGINIVGPKGISVQDLDYLIDDKANSIGAMLWHLAATERFYQIHTFEGKKWGDWSKEDDELWSTAMGLGDNARKEIKGNDLKFYLDKLESVRAHTHEELAKRDDDWLMAVDEEWPWGPTNNYCKWFHVCEHESNHNGQFKFIKSRLPTT